VLDFTDHTVLVLGLGESGLAIARWVGERGAQVRVADTREAPPMRDALCTAVPTARFHGGELSESLLDGVTLVALSPGLSPTQSAACTPSAAPASAPTAAKAPAAPATASAASAASAARGFLRCVLS
jgi:UDP-N-acetylmuramoylalanine--D-glutamate ligase